MPVNQVSIDPCAGEASVDPRHATLDARLASYLEPVETDDGSEPPVLYEADDVDPT
jgi:hypothetical protein